MDADLIDAIDYFKNSKSEAIRRFEISSEDDGVWLYDHGNMEATALYRVN